MHNSLCEALQLCRSLRMATFVSLICALGLCLGCASGRALTQDEAKEFATLEAQASSIRGEIAVTQKATTVAFQRFSVRSKSSNALLCGARAEILKTGSVPLVYAKKKRVVFKPNGQSTRGCHEMTIQVQP